MKITISKKFQDLIYPLTTEELAILERSILEHGVRDPLVIWQNGKNYLLDGHHRWSIIKKHKISKYKTIKMQFDSNHEAQNFMIENQLARRNCTPEGISYLRGLRYRNEKLQHGGQRGKSNEQNVQMTTSELLGEQYHVSHITIQRDEKFADALELISNVFPSPKKQKEVKYQILTRQINLSKKDILELSEFTPENIMQVLSGEKDLSVVRMQNQPTFYYSAKYIINKKMRTDFADNGMSYRMPKIKKFTNPSIANITNTVYQGNCLNVMHKMIDAGMEVTLIPTSINYNARRYYGKGFNDNKKHSDYLKDIRKFVQLSYSLLRKGGRLVINYDEMVNTEDNTSHVIPLGRQICNIAEEIGFAQLCNIDWIKFGKSRGVMRFGSYGSPSRPHIRNAKENIVVFCKQQFKLPNIEKTKSDMTNEEYVRWTVNVWDIAPNTEQFIPHPSIYPVTMIERIIKLFSWKNDLVLDPFSGICTTGVAAKMHSRRYICIEQNMNYCQYGKDRIEHNIDGKVVGNKMKELYPSFFEKWNKKLEKAKD